MKKITKFLFDLIFPINCLGCGLADQWVCSNCFSKIVLNSTQPVTDLKCHQFLSGVLAATDYNQPLVSEILHRFKYSFVKDLGQNLADILIKFLELKQTESKFDFDLIIAIPLAQKRSLWRGFNQAQVLAELLSQRFNWPTRSNLILRHHYNRPQVGLKATSRIQNVENNFIIKDYNLIKGKKVLLIDDVVTTGATISQCAKVLKQAGAREVWGLVVAKNAI